MPVLTQRRLNRAVLARQMLLDRADVPIPEALERMGGLQAQYAPAMYIGLWSRLNGFTRQQLTDALVQRTVIQGTLLRQTIHLVSAADYWPFALAVRDARRALWLRATRRQLSAEEYVTMAAAVRARLKEQPVVTRKELDAITGGSVGTNGVGLWLDLVRVPPSGTWERRRADLYAAAEDWIGPPAPDLEMGTFAQVHLMHRYLQGFGPASVAEIASWSGLKPAEIKAALKHLDLVTYQAEDGTDLVDLRDAPLPDADAPAPVRFLAVWDALLLAHARRAAVLREEDRPPIFNTKTPHSFNTFLVDGQVEGTWRFDSGHIQVEPLRTLKPKTIRLVQAEADRMEAFHR